MNDRQLEKKVRQDADKVKKDMDTLVRDGTERVSRLDENISQVAGNFSAKVDENAAQLRKGFEKLSGDAKEAVANTTASVMKDVGQGLSQYNAKAKEVAGKVPGGFVDKVTRYPWVAISIGLLVGILMGFVLKPSRRPLGYL